jgi:hypothetical protein
MPTGRLAIRRPASTFGPKPKRIPSGVEQEIRRRQRAACASDPDLIARITLYRNYRITRDGIYGNCQVCKCGGAGSYEVDVLVTWAEVGNGIVPKAIAL